MELAFTGLEGEKTRLFSMIKKIKNKIKKLVMICLLYYLFHLPTNFTKTITNHYELKIDWENPNRPQLFSWAYIFSRTLHAIVTGPFKPLRICDSRP